VQKLEERVVHKSIKFVTKVVAGVALAIGLVGLYFADNIRGYYRFKELCETDGGLMVLHPMKKHVGWRGRKGDYSFASFKDVAFVRYVDGAEYDVRYRSGLISNDLSYDVSPASEAEPVLYEIRWISERLPNEIRTSRSGFEIREIATGRLMVRWYQIGYSTFNQDRTLLAAPSGQTCKDWRSFFAQESQPKYFSN
jgi:hypothetical protein